MTIGIIGGGASGMAAAIAAAENENAQVILLERQARVGRKLGATGNGRCNLSNIHACKQGYHGNQPNFSWKAMDAFSPEQTLAWFAQLGLLTVTEPSGKVYPYSDQANSVVDVLRFALEKPNITVKTGFEVRKVRKTGQTFLIEGDEELIAVDRLIIACGGLAGSKLGGSMSGYKLLAKFGHRSTKLRPALVQIKANWSGVAALKGVRANCHAAIYRDGILFRESTGELQFTEFGLSGPVIFEISRDVCHEKGQWTCRLDFIPMLNAHSLRDMLAARCAAELTADDLLTGILHNRLGRVLTKAAGIKGTTPVRELTDEEITAVVQTIKAFEVPLLEPLGMDSAQVTAGGVMTEDFNDETMESKLVPGLYACGEVLDVDGDCGGYNLQWAWSSGRAAGLHAGKE